ncbi:MAG: IPT/TIG domain-containing protein [Vicinamibacterales bacterium]
MPPIPHVQPGEVIRSSFINTLIDQLNALSGGTTAPPSGVQVPDVFGRTLSQARSLITAPSVNLALGTTLDSSGTLVDPNAPGSATRLVIGQAPSAQVFVPVGSPVNLVIASSSGSTTPPPPPTITRTENLGGIAQSSFRVGETLVIFGNNFSLTTSQNSVSFDGTPAASVTSDPADPTRRLRVVVPTGIPGAPVNPPDPAKPGVVISVSVGGSAAATVAITVNPPSAVPQPTITNINPKAQFVNQNVTIAGTNYSSIQSRNLVRIGTTNPVNATVVSSTTTQIVFTVPDLPDLPGTSLSTIQKPIVVIVTDGTNPIGQAIWDPANPADRFTAIRP